MRVVTFKIEEELLEELDLYARMKGITRSEAIRRAIERMLKEEMRKTRPTPKVIRIYG